MLNINMSTHKDDFNKWMEMWEKSQKDFDSSQEPVEYKFNLGGFFGLQQANDLDKVSTDDAVQWKSVLDRSRQLFDPQAVEVFTEEEDIEVIHPKKKIIKEEKAEGFGKDLSDGPGKDVKFHVNPLHHASVGRDQDLRVTKNWSDGDELVELAKLKSLLYALESDFLRADALGEKTDSLKKRLAEIQEKCHELSERLTPDPKTDVT